MKSSRTQQVIEQTSIYSFAFILTQAISVIGGILMRWFLGPLQTGVWSLMQVILSYVDYFTLGATYAIPIEIPFRRGQDKQEEAERLKDVILSFAFLTSFIVSIGLGLYALLWRDHLRPEVFWGLLVTCGLVILQEINNVLISLLRAYKYFTLAGKQMLISSVVNLFLVAALSAQFRLYGFLLAMVLSFLFNIIFILWHRPISVKWNLNRTDLEGLIRFGFPLMLLTMISTLFLTLDKIMIGRFLGLEALGLYSIATMATGFVFSFPNSIGVVMIPNLSEKFGETKQMKDLRGYLEKSNDFFSCVMPLLIVLAWFLVPWIVRCTIPKFEGGIEAMKSLCLSAYFLAVTQPYANFIVVVKKHFWMAPVTLLSCAFAALANLVAIRQGFGINGVSVATTVSMAFNFTLLYFIAGRYVFKTWEMFREYLFLLVKFTGLLIILWGIDHYISFQSDLLEVSTKTAILLLIMSPLVLHIEKQFAFIDAFKRRFIPSRPEH